MLLLIPNFIECATNEWTAEGMKNCKAFVQNFFTIMKTNAVSKIEDSLSSTEYLKSTINKLVNDASGIEKGFIEKYDDELLSTLTTDIFLKYKQNNQLDYIERIVDGFYHEINALKPLFLFFKEVSSEAMDIIKNRYNGPNKNELYLMVEEKVESLEHYLQKMDIFEERMSLALDQIKTIKETT